jgi:hypothetical protein
VDKRIGADVASGSGSCELLSAEGAVTLQLKRVGQGCKRLNRQRLRPHIWRNPSFC